MKRDYNLDLERFNNARIAKGFTTNKPISVKYATELCNFIKGKSVKRVEQYLDNVLERQEFIPLRKFSKKVAHRKGSAVFGVKAGRYGDKTIKIMQDLLEQVKANADFKGLDENKLIVLHAFASKGFRRQGMQMQGRISGKMRKLKSGHLELVLQERDITVRGIKETKKTEKKGNENKKEIKGKENLKNENKSEVKNEIKKENIDNKQNEEIK